MSLQNRLDGEQSSRFEGHTLWLGREKVLWVGWPEALKLHNRLRINWIESLFQQYNWADFRLATAAAIESTISIDFSSWTPESIEQ